MISIDIQKVKQDLDDIRYSWPMFRGRKIRELYSYALELLEAYALKEVELEQLQMECDIYLEHIRQEQKEE